MKKKQTKAGPKRASGFSIFKEKKHKGDLILNRKEETRQVFPGNPASGFWEVCP